MKLAVLTNIISPYRIAFFNSLATCPSFQIKVFYAAEQERQRAWHSYYSEMRYPYEMLTGYHFPCGKRRTLHINTGLSKHLNSYKPDVLVIGTDILSTPSSWSALLWARKHEVPVIRYEGKKSCHFFSRWKTAIYATFYNRCDRFFVYSIDSKCYLENFDIPKSHIVIGYNVGDTSLFRDKVPVIRADANFIHERKKYPNILFLYVGQLISQKGVDLLLQAWTKADLKDAGLFIIGNGPLYQQVERIANGQMRGRLFPIGFLQREELLHYYALADVFILPSLSDPASIALGEALHSGLYSVASTHDGSARNFIIEGVNGLIIDPLKPGALLQALMQVAGWVREAPSCTREIILSGMAEYTVERYAQRLAQLACTLVNINPWTA